MDKIIQLWELLIVDFVGAYTRFWKAVLLAFVTNIGTPGKLLIDLADAMQQFQQDVLTRTMDSLFILASDMIPQVPGLRQRVMTCSDVAAAIVYAMAVIGPRSLLFALTPSEATVWLALDRLIKRLNFWTNFPLWLSKLFVLTGSRLFRLGWVLLRTQILMIAVFVVGTMVVGVLGDITKHGAGAEIFATKLRQDKPRHARGAAGQTREERG